MDFFYWETQQNRSTAGKIITVEQFLHPVGKLFHVDHAVNRNMLSKGCFLQQEGQLPTVLCSGILFQIAFRDL